MRIVTFCTTTIAGMHFRACAEHTSGCDVTSGHVASGSTPSHPRKYA
jgi:hypothetical protein